MDNELTYLVFDLEEEEEEIIYECYYCNWTGTDPFEQCTDLWEEEEIMYLCPVCGQFLS